MEQIDFAVPSGTCFSLHLTIGTNVYINWSPIWMSTYGLAVAGGYSGSHCRTTTEA